MITRSCGQQQCPQRVGVIVVIVVIIVIVVVVVVVSADHKTSPKTTNTARQERLEQKYQCQRLPSTKLSRQHDFKREL